MVRKSTDFVPFMIEKIAIPYDSETRHNYLSKIDVDTLIQQYIYSMGGKSSFIRFLYHNP